MSNLPEPRCIHGYPEDQLLDMDNFDYFDFVKWLGDGPTWCSAEEYSSWTGEYAPIPGCHHKTDSIYSVEDVARYLARFGD